MDLDLAGRRALVTGSSSGIGAGVARILAEEGAAVVIHGRNVERAQAVAKDLADRGARTAVAIGDLATDEGSDAVAKAALEAFGGIDILVNNAGGSAKGETSWFKVPARGWVDVYQANTLAAVRLIHALVPDMRERGWGRVINIGSAAAVTPTSGQPEYGPAKAALINMSLGLSKNLRNSGVTSNVVSPGMIRTEGLEKGMALLAEKRGFGDDAEKGIEIMLKGIGQTVNRIGEVDDVGYAVAMLASPRSGFINGTNLHIDGGISPAVN